MILHYLKFAFRELLKRKLYSILGISGFALGLTVFIFIVLFVYHEFQMDSVYEHHERIFRLIDVSDNTADLDFNIGQILKDKYPEINLACPVRQKTKWPFLFQTKENFIETESFISTSNDFFNIFSIHILKSSNRIPLSDDNSLVITQSTATKLFGSKDPIGQTVIFMGKPQLTVTALISDLPERSSFKAGLILNVQNQNFRFGKIEKNGKIINPINIFIQLKENINVSNFTKQLNTTLHNYTSNVGIIILQPVSSIYLEKSVKGNFNKEGNLQLIYLFVLIALLILSLSIINYTQFVLAEQQSRLKTICVMMSHGADFRHLMAYCLTESVLALTISFGLAIFLVKITFPFANYLFNGVLDFSNLLSWQVLILLSFTLLFVLAIVTIITVWKLKQTGIRPIWRDKILSTNRHIGGSIMIVFQLSISIVMICCVIGINKQLNLIKENNLGFHSEHLLRLNPPSTFHNFETLKKKLKEYTFIENCSWSNGTPGYINLEDIGGPEGEQFKIHGIGADLDFVKTFGIKQLEGRDLLSSDLEKGCLINETALRKLKYNHLDEIKSKSETGLSFDIIGVVRDFHVASLHSQIEPTLIFLSQTDISFLNVRLKPGNILWQMSQVKRIWHETIPDSPFNYTFYDEYFGSLYQAEERQGKAITVFSMIVLLITCMGILGKIFHICFIRTKEIGIRKVNGAKILEIILMLNKDLARLLVIAFIIACPVAWYIMHKWLQNFAYKTTLSWWIYALAGAVTMLIALITVSWQSLRAASRNPVESLRSE